MLIVEELLKALRKVDGLRPSTPVLSVRVPWDVDGLAVDVADDVVCVRVVATRLPLPALLTEAGAVLRTVLVGTQWESARLRLVVTDVDRDALNAS
ncbi:hypothetical protein [Lentzea guizhouensis]|uniref:hypothetical protein n=1 Tax=Lentzea guizhouensis TaxID=1586287 RepID=UPI0009F4E9F4|nr:hypothetical protein [Lentzea guizhouensis]